MPKLRRLLELPQRSEPEPPRRTIRTQRRLTSEQQAELVAHYEDGSTVYELADRFGIHRDTASLILERAGVARRYHQETYVDQARAEELHAVGLTLTDVAEVLGIGRTTLVKARRRAMSGAR